MSVQDRFCKWRADAGLTMWLEGSPRGIQGFASGIISFLSVLEC